MSFKVPGPAGFNVFLKHYNPVTYKHSNKLGLHKLWIYDFRWI